MRVRRSWVKIQSQNGRFCSVVKICTFPNNYTIFEETNCIELLATVAQKGQSQISLPKHKTISQNTNQFPKTQNNFPKHKLVSQNTNRFLKTQINFSKHEAVCQNTNQFLETQTNFANHN